MKILVTGGTGYIGSHNVVALYENGFNNIVIVDNLSNSSIKVLDGIKKITGVKPIFEKIDVADKKQVDFLFKKHQSFDAIIHFAAFKSVFESVDNPIKYYRNNINSTVNILKAMLDYKIPHLVFSSSCTVYGEPDKLPVTEKSPIKKANSPYGNTKQICEDIIYDTVKIHKEINAISLRYFNPIGSHPTAFIGELPLGKPDNLIPFITQTAIGLREELNVFGNDYDTADGYCIRDFIDIMDLADAHIAAMNRLLNNKQKNRYEIFNIGTGKGASVMEIIKSFEKVAGEKLKYKVVDRRPGDVSSIYADATLVKKEMNWESKRSIEDSLKTAWLWENKYRELN